MCKMYGESFKNSTCFANLISIYIWKSVLELVIFFKKGGVLYPLALLRTAPASAGCALSFTATRAGLPRHFGVSKI